jgi:hypothetical protein
MHNHGDEPTKNSPTFCEIHLGLFNGTGEGGMVDGKDETEQHYTVKKGDEHGPFWKIDPITGKPVLRANCAVYYDDHRWNAGGKRVTNAQDEAFDIWAVFEIAPEFAVVDRPNTASRRDTAAFCINPFSAMIGLVGLSFIHPALPAIAFIAALLYFSILAVRKFNGLRQDLSWITSSVAGGVLASAAALFNFILAKVKTLSILRSLRHISETLLSFPWLVGAKFSAAAGILILAGFDTESSTCLREGKSAPSQEAIQDTLKQIGSLEQLPLVNNPKLDRLMLRLAVLGRLDIAKYLGSAAGKDRRILGIDCRRRKRKHTYSRP